MKEKAKTKNSLSEHGRRKSKGEAYMGEAKSENKRIIIIDGNSLINRAYYAIQRPMITRDGLYTQGVYGFLNILNKAVKDYEPGYLAVAFDRKAPTFRHEEYAEYKAGRKKMPPELAMQMPLLKEVLEAMNIKILEIDGFEADDILGTVARRGEEEGLEPLIITGDRDSFQLATKVTKIIYTKRGITEMELYDEDAMYEKYGFSPRQFIDYKGLMGDPSDNIPGLPGVGEKTASKLIHEFGSIANLLDSTDQISSPKLRKNIEENAQLALMSRRLAEINTNVPIEIDFAEFRLEEPDYDALISVYTKLEFNSFLKKLRMPAAFGENAGRAGDTKERRGQESRPRIRVENGEQFAALKKDLEESRRAVLKVYSDGNHRDCPSLDGVGLLSEKAYYYIDGKEKQRLEDLREFMLSCPLTLCGHQIQADYYALLCNGWENWLPETGFDTSLGQYLLEPGRSDYKLNALSMEYLHEDLLQEVREQGKEEQMGFLDMEDGVSDYEESGFRWCLAAESVWAMMEPQLEFEGLTRVLREIELPLAFVLADMEAQGVAVNQSTLEEIGNSLKAKLDELTEEIYRLAGESFNINSPKQLGTILFEKLGLPAGKKTKSGYSTNADTLESLKEEHEIVALILEYRTLSKLNGTYVEGLIPLIHKDGKIHAHFQPTVTATGRISCTEPNLQNIPIRQEIGRTIRKAFVPQSEEWILVGADYSQIELRVLAHLSEDEALIEAFRKGADIHRSTAARIFGVSEEDVTPLMRSRAKAINFGVIYGMSGFRLSSELHISRRDAEAYIDEYFKTYPGVKSFMNEAVAQGKAQGYVTTIFDRKRPIPEINASSYTVRQLGERLAMNSPIQGSAADIIKLAMIACHKALLEKDLRSRLILQIHDELIVLAHKEELEEVKVLLRETMENALKLRVALSVDLNTGETWYDLK